MNGMMKGILSFLLTAAICVAPISVSFAKEGTLVSNREEEPEVPMIQSRSSRIISSHAWELGRQGCSVWVSFNDKATGSGTIYLQKKTGAAWTNIRSLKISFSNVMTALGEITALELSSGTYRIRMDLKATLFGATQDETIYLKSMTLD